MVLSGDLKKKKPQQQQRAPPRGRYIRYTHAHTCTVPQLREALHGKGARTHVAV